MFGENLVITVQGKNFNISFPTNGQFIAMETEKIRLSGGTYYELMRYRSYSVNAIWTLDLIDAIVFYKILCPELIDLAVVKLEDIHLEDFEELLKIYKEEISPWYVKWLKKIMKIPQNDDETKDDSLES